MFKAGISDPVNTVLAWYVARDAGFYAANGLNVDILNMSGGSLNMLNGSNIIMGDNGNTGSFRSNAWMEVFSSTESTTAFWGGCMYNPTTASIFGSNSGSLECFQYRNRWGWMDSAARTD